MMGVRCGSSVSDGGPKTFSSVITVFLLVIACCTAGNEPWLKPIKPCVLACIIIPLVLDILVLLAGMLTLLAAVAASGDPASAGSARALRYLRFLRLAPLAKLVCWSILFSHARRAAKASLEASPKV